jgi:hypothetical protein
MRREIIGECPASGEDPELNDCETELMTKYIKQECGPPPREVEVQVTLEDHELGSYPVISVVWDDGETEYPAEYVQKCIEAFERFELPEEIHRKGSERMDFLREMYADMEKWFEAD